MLKKLFVQKKWPITWLANKSSLELRSQYSEAPKAAATKVKLSKERAWKEFGERLDNDFKMSNKVIWHTIHRLRGKRSRAAFFIEDSSAVTLKDQDQGWIKFEI